MYSIEFKQLCINGYKILKIKGYKGEKLKELFTELYEVPIRTLYSWLKNVKKIKQNKKKNITINSQHNINNYDNTNKYNDIIITPKIETEVIMLFNKKITNLKKVIKFIYNENNIKINKKQIHCIYRTNNLIINNPQLKNKIDIFILDTIKEYKTINAKQISMMISEKFSDAKNKIYRSKTYIYKVLKQNNYTYKNTKIKNNPYTIEEQKQQVKEIKEKLTKYKDYKCISLDEMHITNFEQCSKGWSLKGTECEINIKKSNIRNERFTFLGASSEKKIENYTFVNGSMKTDNFIKFITKLTILDKDKQNIYFMDNATIHKSIKFKKFIETTGIIVVYNAPYHSEFNPIELVFSLLRKELQKGNNKTKDDIINIINNFKNNMNNNKSNVLNKIFKHSFKCMDKFLE